MYRGTRALVTKYSRIAFSGRPAGSQRILFTRSPSLSSTRRWPANVPRAGGQLIWRAQYATDRTPQPDKRDEDKKRTAAQQILKPRPEEVTTESSVRHLFEPSSQPAPEPKSISEGVSDDLAKVKDTVSLRTVPREPLTFGLAGTLPYLATSISTMYFSWDMNAQWPTESQFVNSFMVSHESAAQWLQLLEPIQLGYGAVIISFLGAIHWGLEFAEPSRSRERARFRYGVGVLAPAVAWPTMVMPIEWALTSQFLAFIMLYFADARATARGWTPPWYSTYRFVLTFIVGGAILLSLVTRAKIGEGEHTLTTQNIRRSMHKGPKSVDKYVNWEKLEQEEKDKIHKEKEGQEKKDKEGEPNKDKEDEKDGKDKEEEGKQDKGGAKKDNAKKTAGEEESDKSGDADEESKAPEDDGGKEKEKKD